MGMVSKAIPLLFASLLSMVRGWGRTGHDLTAALSSRLISDETEEYVASVLGNESLVDVANWADSVTKDMKWSQPLHFINVNDECDNIENCQFTYSRDCVDDVCVAGAIANYTGRLLHDFEGGDDAEYEYLKFLVHFVGDAHQPLHCARADDLGGNTISPVYYNVTDQGNKWDLHQIWDFGMIENHVSDVEEGADSLMTLIEDGGKWVGEVEDWLECEDGSDTACTSSWGQESVGYSLSFAYPDAKGNQIKAGDEITDEYVEDRWENVVQKRLLMGGVRLARILESVAKTRKVQRA